MSLRRYPSKRYALKPRAAGESSILRVEALCAKNRRAAGESSTLRVEATEKMYDTPE